MWVRVWLAGAWRVCAWRVATCLAGACVAGLLSACAVVDPVDARYDTISRSLAKARNESIFLNIVRASHDYPLSFVTVSNVTPTMTNTATIASCTVWMLIVIGLSLVLSLRRLQNSLCNA